MPPTTDAEIHSRMPLDGLSTQQMVEKIHEFMKETGLSASSYAGETNIHSLFYRGAFLAQMGDSCSLHLHKPSEPNPETGSSGTTDRINYSFVDEGGRVFVNKKELDWIKLEVRDCQIYTTTGPSREAEQDANVDPTTGPTREDGRDAPQTSVVSRIQKLLGSYPATVYWLIVLCSVGAMVQGFDETAVNGAQVFYMQEFGLNQTEHNEKLGRDTLTKESAAYLGLINGAPYAVSAIACLFNNPLNRILGGRRGVIFVTCFISFVWCLAQAFAWTREEMLVFRLLLGLGIGPKSATIPVYASECSPSRLRGALVMMWQLWTAFGIMLGFIFGAAFWEVDSEVCKADECSRLNWRLMLAAPMIPPLIPMLYVFTLPESPRYLLQAAMRTDNKTEKHARYEAAFESLRRLNHCPLIASRECFWIYTILLWEKDNYPKPETQSSLVHTAKSVWTEPRTRRALIASAITMFLQQFCGVNVMAYYSTSIISQANHHEKLITVPKDGAKAYIFSLVFGVLNWLFAFPALFLMDTLGRRSLLLLTFPFLAIFQFLLAGIIHSKEPSIPGVAVSMYLFCIFYSIGEGPVPFVYASESMPLHHRDFGMGIVTFITWAFNFILAITWPSFVVTFDLSGSFAWYGAWCCIGWFLIFFFVPETKQKRLEDLSSIFNAPFKVHRKFAIKEFKWFMGFLFQRSSRGEKPDIVDFIDNYSMKHPMEGGIQLQNMSHEPGRRSSLGGTSTTHS